MLTWPVFKEALLVVCAVTGTGVGVVGLSTWRRQLRGTADFEVARSALRALLRVRPAFSFVRSRGIFAAELQDREGERRAGSADRYCDEEQVFGARWQHLSAALADLEAAVVEAEVLWGQDIQRLIDPIRSCVRDLSSALDEFLTLARDGDLFDRSEAVKIRKRFLQPLNGDDALSALLADAVRNVEKEMRNHLKR